MKILTATIFLFCLLLTKNAFTQSFKTYSLPNEGFNIQINCLYQLSNGYIILGTTKGLYKFDGINFQIFQKEDNVPDNITAICEEKNGKTWIGFANGNLGWLQKNTLCLQQSEEGFPAKAIKKIVQDSTGVIWIATAGEGIYYYKNAHFYNINSDDGLTDNYVYDITIHKNYVVAGTDRGINFCAVENGKKMITHQTSMYGAIPDNIVRSLFSHNNSLLLGMQDAGVAIKKDKHLTTTNNWKYGIVNSIISDNNTVWIATENNGVIITDTSLKKSKKIFSDKATFLLKGKENNIWIASNNNLIRTNGNKLQLQVNLIPDQATGLHALLVDKNRYIWFNDKAKLHKFGKDAKGDRLEKTYDLPLPKSSQITSLYEDEFSHLWIGTMGDGILIMDPATEKIRKLDNYSTFQKANILSITGKDNQVWIASLEGVSKCILNKSNESIFQPLNVQEFKDINKVGTNYIYNIFIDSKNRVWFATDGKGIALYENGKIVNYGKKQGLKSEVVYQVTEDVQGNIWFIAFNVGVVKFDGKQFHHYGISEGLSDINLTSMTSDNFGNLYLGHKNGIDIVDTKTNLISYLDDEQGLSNINTDLNTITSDREGNIYFLSGSQIYQYIPTKTSTQPTILIDRIQLFLNDINVNDGYTFSSSEDNITFYYSGLYYSQPQKIQYQYKLDGYGNEWITTNDKRKDFPKLPPGNYTFRVRASLSKNFENASESTFRFTIRKPLWQQWWFLLLSGIGLVAALYFVIKQRERAIQKWERLEKEKIQSQFETLRNQVNPHFLFNSFNTLVSEIEEDPKKAVEYVEHMADFFRSIVTYRKKDVISLAEEISIIKDYLFIQSKRYGDAFKVHFKLTKEEQTKFYMAPLTLQLLAENAIKHNSVLKSNPLQLDIFIEAGQLVVRNNICTKVTFEKGAGLGLQNIQKRYEMLTKKPVVIVQDDEFFTVIIPLIKQTDND